MFIVEKARRVSISLILTEPLSGRTGWPSDAWHDNWRVSVFRIWYIFTIHPTLNLTINCAHVIVNLFSRHCIWRPSLSDIQWGNPVHQQGVQYRLDVIPLRSKEKAQKRFVSLAWDCLLGTGLIDGQASSTCMFSRAAVNSQIFASFTVYSMYYSNLARLRWLGFRSSKAGPWVPRKKRSKRRRNRCLEGRDDLPTTDTRTERSAYIVSEIFSRFIQP